MAESNQPSTMPSAPTPEKLAPLFPNYQIKALVDQGSMGAVYKAHQESLDRDVAIKIISKEFAKNSEFRAAFESQAKAMARLHHPNLIPVYDFGEVDGMLFMVMEFIEGKSLLQSTNRKVIAPEIAIPLISKICRGLDHAHNGGVIHRDIRPTNIFLDQDSAPRISDFTPARPTAQNISEDIDTRVPGYTAPEVFQGKPADQRSDIFSLGAMLYELTSGTAPVAESYQMTSGISEGLDAIIQKATSSAPASRHSSTAELANELEEYLRALSYTPRTAAQPAQPATTTAAAAARRHPSRSSGPTVLRKKTTSSGSRSLFPILTLLVLGAAIAAFFFLWKNRDISDDANANQADASDGRSQDQAIALSTNEKELLQLRDQLLAGERDAFPSASVKRGGSQYLLIDRLTSWEQASNYAMSVGGSLATLATPADLKWAQETFQRQGDKRTWVGASDSGQEGQWHWNQGQAVDIELWTDDHFIADLDQQELNDFATLNQKRPKLEALSAKYKLPFLIEWKRNGANPGSLSAQLKRTEAEITAGRPPIYPNGTSDVDGSRFLLVISQKPLTWKKASSLAKQAGGHLAVASNTKEATHLTNLVRKSLNDGQAAWIGGKRTDAKSNTWTTVTGERFDFLKWLPGEPDNFGGNQDAVKIEFLNKKIGINDDASAGSPEKNTSAVSSYVIEWSTEDLRNMPKKGETPTSHDPYARRMSRVRERIVTKHGYQLKDYRTKEREIVAQFVDGASKHLTTVQNGDIPTLERELTFLNNMKRSGFSPEEFTKTFGDRMPDHLSSVKEALQELNQEYTPKFKRAQIDYLKALGKAAVFSAKEGASEEGASSLAKTYFAKEINIVRTDNQYIFKILSDDSIKVPAKAGKKGAGNNNNNNTRHKFYIGKWKTTDADAVFTIEFKADGSANISGINDATGTWTAKKKDGFATLTLQDRTFQVKRARKELQLTLDDDQTYVLKRDRK